jgi:uncharacterized protein (DUF39 family)
MKTYLEINKKIKNGTAVVVTKDEIIDIVKDIGEEKALETVDVVTCATFGPMCSSGAFINFGHSNPPIRMQSIKLNNVDCSGGLAAVDTYLGATQESNDKGYSYGGAHVICDLIKGSKIHLSAKSRGSDCYPKKEIETFIDKNSINEAYLFNPRNCYQNYSVAVNCSDKTVYTYMGKLLPNMENGTYSNAGYLSPLLNDPNCKHIGIGTKIFLCGAEGYISWYGTQFNSQKDVNLKGIPLSPSRTLAVIGNIKEMDSKYIKPISIENYGVSICIGIGIPIPITDMETLRNVCISDKDIETQIVDYSSPNLDKPIIAKVNYEQLNTGLININGKQIKVKPISSISKAKQIASELKEWIIAGKFTLNESITKFPDKSTINILGKENE